MQDEILFHLLFNLGLIPKNPLPGNLPTLDILNEWDINRDKVLKKREIFGWRFRRRRRRRRRC